MSGHSDLPEYRGAPARSGASPIRVPILGAARATVDTDDRVPLLFDDVPYVTTKAIEAARTNGGRHGTAAGETRLEAPHDSLRHRQPVVGSEPDAPGASPATPMLLTVRQVEATLQLGRTRTYELLRSGQLPMLRVGRLIRVSRIALEEWIAHQTIAGCD
jgi:excisionase family DNA binding protein